MMNCSAWDNIGAGLVGKPFILIGNKSNIADNGKRANFCLSHLLLSLRRRPGYPSQSTSKPKYIMTKTEGGTAGLTAVGTALRERGLIPMRSIPAVRCIISAGPPGLQPRHRSNQINR